MQLLKNKILKKLADLSQVFPNLAESDCKSPPRFLTRSVQPDARTWGSEVIHAYGLRSIDLAIGQIIRLTAGALAWPQ